MGQLISVGQLLVKTVLKISYTLGYLIGLAAIAVLLVKTDLVPKEWTLVVWTILLINVTGRLVSLTVFLFNVEDRGWENLAEKIGSRFPKILILVAPDSRMEKFLNRIGLSYWKYLGTTGCEIFWSSINAGIHTKFLPVAVIRTLLVTSVLIAVLGSFVYLVGFVMVPELLQSKLEVVAGNLLLIGIVSVVMLVLWGVLHLLFFLTKIAARFFCPIKIAPKEKAGHSESPRRLLREDLLRSN